MGIYDVLLTLHSVIDIQVLIFPCLVIKEYSSDASQPLMIWSECMLG